MTRITKYYKSYLPIFSAMLFTAILSSPIAFAQDEELAASLTRGKDRDNSNSEDSGSIGSFFGSLSENRHNPIGLSFAAYQLHASDAIPNDSGSYRTNISIVRTRIFTNISTRRSRLHLDFGGGYRFSKDDNADSSAELDGIISYGHQPNRHLDIKIINRILSLSTEYANIFDVGSFQQTTIPNTSYTLLQNNRRITLNELQGEFNLKLSRNNTFGMSGAYKIYRIADIAFNNTDTDSIQLGANYSYALTRWMSFSSNWSSYMNNVDSRLPDTRVHKVEIGGFNFNLSRRWNLAVLGGVDVLSQKNKDYRADASARAHLSHNSRTNTIFLGYQRGFIAADGLAQVLQSDVLTAGFGQQFLRRMRWLVSGSCFSSRGNNAVDSSSRYRSCYVNSSLEFSVLRNLVAVLVGGYQNQNNMSHLVAGNTRIDRYHGSFGLQYFFPSLSR